MNRFRRIRTEFGAKALLRTTLLLAGVLGMAVFDYFAFSSVRAGIIAVVGLALGFFFRRKIAEGVEFYNRAFSVGLFAMALFDYFAFSSVRAGLIAVVGLALGLLFRRKIAAGVEYYPRALSAGLFVYSITLSLGDLFGLDNSVKLAVITATTVVIFGLQFWSLSDPSVRNVERDARGRAVSL